MAKTLSEHAGCPSCGRSSHPNLVCGGCLSWVDHGDLCQCPDCVTTLGAIHDYQAALLASARTTIAAQRLSKDLMTAK